MKTTLELPPEIAAASTRSLRERQEATIAALDSFMEQDEDEHRETLRLLRHALDEDRPAQRLVFGAGNDPQWVSSSCSTAGRWDW